MDTRTKRRPGELAFSILIAVFSMAALWQAFEISRFEGLSTPGMFPMLAASAMAISGIFILRDTLKKTSRGEAFAEAVLIFLKDALPLTLILLVGLIALYVVTLTTLGFLVSSGIFLTFAIMLLYKGRPLFAIVITGCAMVVIHFVFRIIFQLVLPQGKLFQSGLIEIITGWMT